jgi:hypothetical protein
MNYKKIYDALMRQAQSRPEPTQYTETHHIIPRSLGGENDPENLVALTARQHFLAHYCLWKAQEKGTEARRKMAYAFNLMRGNPNGNDNRYINSRLYASHRKEYSEMLSESRSGENNPMYGKTHSEEARQKLRESHIGENNPFYGQTHSEETIRKMSEARRGENNPCYGRTGELNPRYGKPISEEQKMKSSITLIESGLKTGKTKGYRINKRTGRYEAHACINGKQKYLGTFATPEEAQAVSLPVIKENLRNYKARLEALTLKKAA